MKLNRHNYSKCQATIMPIVGFDFYSKPAQADLFGRIVSRI
jgi:hypothetical protein